MEPSNTESSILLLLGAAFICALLIERVLEILKAVFNYREAQRSNPDRWNLRAIAVTRNYLNAKQTAPDLAEALGRQYLFSDQASTPTVDANHVRRRSNQARFKAMGVLLGIALAFGLDLNLIDVVICLQQPGEASCTGDPSASFALLRDIVGKLAMGVGMGLGAAPLNEMIARLESAYQSIKQVRS